MMMLAFCGCSQHWVFLPSDSPDAIVRPLEPISTEIAPRRDISLLGGEKQPAMPASHAEPFATPTSQTPTSQTSTSQTPGVVLSMLRESATPLPTQANPLADPTYGEDFCYSAVACPTFTERFCARTGRGWCDVRCDYRRYYSYRTGRDLLMCVGAAAIMANTSIDQNFRGWVQDNARSSGSDNFASFWKTFGEGKIFIPAFAGLALVGSILDECPKAGTVGNFGYRTTRSYLVGTPPMLFMQYCLGASRPEEGNGSEWHPFSDNNGISGHAFCGAVPFITAAQMTDNCCMKGCFYFMSTLPGWSRINDDSHYLSQAWMGWWMAYLSCRAVSETEQDKKCYSIAPIMAPDTMGMMFEYRR